MARNRLRAHLAGVRLALLYVVGCALVVAGGLLWRATLEAGVGLNRTLPAANAHAGSLPFAGVTVQLQDQPTAAIDTRLARLREAGFGWARQRFDWQRIEPAPGEFDWAESDRLIGAITRAGIVPVAVLDGSPGWAQAQTDRAARNGLAPPADLADFARFAAAFASRYGDRLRFYQIWDEPNIAPHWGERHVNPVAYAQMLRAIAPAIRSNDADAVIASAALAPTVDRGHLAIDEVYFVQRMIAAGAAPFIDAVAIQPFGFGDSPANPRQRADTLNFARAALIRRALADAGLGDKPLWAVRYGWNRMFNSPWGTVTAADQTEYAAGALDRAWVQWPWLTAMGWAIDQPAEAPGMPAWGFALTDTAGRPVAVLEALSAWQAQARKRSNTPPPVPWLGWIVWSLAGGLAGWRGVTAARLIDWRDLLARYRAAPPWLHGALWLALAAIYYLATFPPLIGLCWLAAVLLCLAQPQAGLWLAVALIPFYYQHKDVRLVDAVMAVPPAHLLAISLLPATIARLRRPSPLAPRPSPFGWWELVPLLLLPLSLLATVNVWQWPAYWRGTLDLVVIPLLLWLEVRVLAPTVRDRRRVLAALFAGGVLAATIGLAGWLRGNGAEVDGIRRLVGPHFSPNHTALYLERSLFLGLAAVFLVARRWRPVVIAVTGLVAFALVLTGSRGALLLGVPAGLAVLTGLAGYRRPAQWHVARTPRRWAIGAASAALVLLLLLVLGQRERLANLETIVLRLDVWRAALALWRDHFWAGVGPGGFFWSYPAYLRPGAVEVDQLHPHSLWLELVTTWGVWGVAWFVLIGAALVTAMRQQRNAGIAAFWITAGACAGLAAALAHAQTDTFLLLADLAAWNAVAWALATAPVSD